VKTICLVCLALPALLSAAPSPETTIDPAAWPVASRLLVIGERHTTAGAEALIQALPALKTAGCGMLAIELPDAYQPSLDAFAADATKSVDWLAQHTHLARLADLPAAMQARLAIVAAARACGIKVIAIDSTESWEQIGILETLILTADHTYTSHPYAIEAAQRRFQINTPSTTPTPEQLAAAKKRVATMIEVDRSTAMGRNLLSILAADPARVVVFLGDGHAAQLRDLPVAKTTVYISGSPAGSPESKKEPASRALLGGPSPEDIAVAFGLPAPKTQPSNH
jgi:hypothetical protein